MSLNSDNTQQQNESIVVQEEQIDTHTEEVGLLRNQVASMVGPLYDEAVHCKSNLKLDDFTMDVPVQPSIISSLDLLIHAANAFCGTVRYVCRS